MFKAVEDFDNATLSEIDDKIKLVSEMSLSERQFLNGLIRKSKPIKIVEIGVAAGASSVVILNAIKDLEGAKLYSLDYSTEYYRDKTKKTGFIVELFPELNEKWELKTGGMSCNFLEEIGSDIDICLLDTAHVNPGEFLDYLQVLPFMKKNGLIVIHDTTLHAIHKYSNFETCGILLSAIKGRKLVPMRTEREYFANIAAVFLDDDAKQRALDVFYCLCLPWSYMPSTVDIKGLETLFAKYYSSDLLDIFKSALNYNSNLLKDSTSFDYKPLSFFRKVMLTCDCLLKR